MPQKQQLRGGVVLGIEERDGDSKDFRQSAGNLVPRCMLARFVLADSCTRRELVDAGTCGQRLLADSQPFPGLTQARTEHSGWW